MTSILGIDLGTTYSVVAVMAEDGPRILPNSLGEPLTPSVVGLDQKNCVLVGQEAREWSVLHPERCAAVFKRHMGSDHKVKLAGRTFSPEELSSLVLRRLKEDAEAHLGRKVERAVITVPAYFNDRQRTATLQAGEIAGFKVERIFNEPTAAALAYGFHEARAEKVLLIFDLGGGTFDVSLVESFEGILEVKASAGEIFLGGEDFTRSLAGHVLRQVGMAFEKAELEHPLLVARLLRQCEIAKCRLTVRERVLVRLPDARGELDESSREVEVTRADFEQATGRILARVEGPVRRVLGDAGLRREDVHEIILVGGATRMPAVVDLVQRSFGKKPQCRLDPDQVVALGAAVQAGLIDRHAGVEDLVVTDVSPFTLGIEISKVFDTAIQDGYFLPIIHRNATIPISRVEPVCTLHANQTEIRVRIFQGDNRKTEQNLFLGEFVVSGIPPGPPGRPIDVRFTYDLNGILEVEATVLETKRSFNHVVTRFARGLSRDQIARAVRDLARLKMHPREDSRNRLLLARSERLFRELPRMLRDELGLLLDAFEAALASQDLGRIEQERAPLEMFLSRCDPGTDDDGEEFAHDG